MFIKKQETELQTERKLQKAGTLLGFSKNQAVTADMVRKAYTDLIKEMHPDVIVLKTRQIAGTALVRTLDDLRKAKDLLLKHMENDDA